MPLPTYPLTPLKNVKGVHTWHTVRRANFVKFSKKIRGGGLFLVFVFSKKIPEKIFEFINKVVYMQYK